MTKSNYKLHVKNMVCPRCIETVKNILKSLNIKVKSIQLGEIIILNDLTKKQTTELQTQLVNKGFELLEDVTSKLIGQIKSIVINNVHYSEEPISSNFSTYLVDKLNHDYSYLSRLFSSVEGITIEKFILSQKIEKVKELLFYDELSLSEIAYHLNYSSVAHLSSQFKKETGMTATEFKKLKKPAHKPLDSI